MFRAYRGTLDFRFFEWRNPMAQQPQSATPPTPPPFVENPNVVETFADSLHTVGIGSGVVTLTFAVTRTEDGKPPKLLRTPAARLVLTLPAAVELQQKISAVLTMLQQSAQNAATASAPKTNQ
jgi:hypothetical protein